MTKGIDQRNVSFFDISPHIYNLNSQLISQKLINPIILTIEIMASMIKPLHELITQLISFEERIEPYKMTRKQIGQIFCWLDQRRRGSVDVSDFYAKFSDLSQSELFYIFKFLDISRKGAFTQQDLETVLCVKSTSFRDPQDDSTRSFTNLIRVLKATFHLIQQHKRKLSLTPSSIEQIFSKATMKRKDKIDMTDLIILFKEANLEVNEKMVHYLKLHVFVRAAMDLREFGQAFGQFVWHQEKRSQKEVHGGFERQRAEEFLADRTAGKGGSVEKANLQLDKIFQKYRSVGSEALKDNFPSESPTGMPRYDLKNEKEFRGTETYLKKYTDLDNNRIDQLLNFTPSSPAHGSIEINKRREELRKGSLERQRIIDEVVNKKRAEFSSKPGMLYSPGNLKIVTREEQLEQRFSSTAQNYRPSTPSLKSPQERPTTFDNTFIGKLYENPLFQKQLLLRPASASKTTSSYFQNPTSKFDHASKSDLLQFYRKGTETPKAYTYERQKENILKKAEEEATRKIQEIQRRARLKVMEKRSATGVYNRWLK